MQRAALFVLSSALWPRPAVLAQDQPLLATSPTLSRTHIAFAYAGDLWTVPRAGGEAVRLTTGVGTETGPRFSPDGTTLAFTAEYDGNLDVYIGSGDGRRAAAPDLPPGRGLRPRVDAGRQARPLRVLAHQRERAIQPAVHDGRGRRVPRRPAAADGQRGGDVARRRADRLRAHPAGVQHLEALPRRPGDADLDRPPRRLDASSACRAPTRTTSTRCGRPATPAACTSSRTATVPSRSSPTTPPPSRWRVSSRTTGSTSSRPRPAPTASSTSSSAASTCSTSRAARAGAWTSAWRPTWSACGRGTRRSARASPTTRLSPTGASARSSRRAARS